MAYTKNTTLYELFKYKQILNEEMNGRKDQYLYAFCLSSGLPKNKIKIH